MTSIKLTKIRYWIEICKIKWESLAPPHRLFIISVVIGILFTACLSVILKNTQNSHQASTSQKELGLYAQRLITKNTPLELLHFAFKKIPQKRTCSKHVTLEDASLLQNTIITHTLYKGTFLCWDDIQKIKATPLTKIRRGHRVMAFKLKNAEIIPLLQMGNDVDAIINGTGVPPISLEHCRVIDILTEEPMVLLEIQKSKLVHQVTGFYDEVQIILKNPKEQKSTTSKYRRPIIQDG